MKRQGGEEERRGNKEEKRREGRGIGVGGRRGEGQ